MHATPLELPVSHLFDPVPVHKQHTANLYTCMQMHSLKCPGPMRTDGKHGRTQIMSIDAMWTFKRQLKMSIGLLFQYLSTISAILHHLIRKCLVKGTKYSSMGDIEVH